MIITTNAQDWCVNALNFYDTREILWKYNGNGNGNGNRRFKMGCWRTVGIQALTERELVLKKTGGNVMILRWHRKSRTFFFWYHFGDLFCSFSLFFIWGAGLQVELSFTVIYLYIYLLVYGSDKSWWLFPIFELSMDSLLGMHILGASIISTFQQTIESVLVFVNLCLFWQNRTQQYRTTEWCMYVMCVCMIA